MSGRAHRLEVRSKIWLEIDGQPVFGQGRADLLRLVGETGSINAAASSMGISYRKAWTYIDSMEKRLGFLLVARRKGGAGGGRSTLTSKAVSMLEKYQRLKRNLNGAVNRKFEGLRFEEGRRAGARP